MTHARFLVLAIAIAMVAWTPPIQAQSRPGRSHAGRSGTRHSSSAEAATDAPLANFTGVVQNVNKKHLSILDADAKVVEFACSKKTAYFQGKDEVKPSALKPGATVTVGARIGIDGKAEAAEVHIQDNKAPAAPAR